MKSDFLEDLFSERLEEERKKMAKEAAVEKVKKLTYRLLTEKYEIIPMSLKNKIFNFNDEDVLDLFFSKAIRTDSLAEYERQIDQVIQQQ